MNVVSQIRYYVYHLRVLREAYGNFQKHTVQNFSQWRELCPSASRSVNTSVMTGYACFRKTLSLHLSTKHFCSYANTSDTCATKCSEINKLNVENSASTHVEVLDNDILALYADLWFNEESKNRILLIIKEYEAEKALRKQVPATLAVNEVLELLNLETRSQRKKYLSFLFKKEKLKLSGRIKKERAREQRVKDKESKIRSKHIEYGFGENALILAVRKASMNRFYDTRTAHASILGQKIVIDLDYDEFMSRRESKNCAEQVSYLWNANRFSNDPFDLHFCNARPCNASVQFLKKIMPYLSQPECLINCVESSYLDIFPKEDLVYLSPHAKETLNVYNHKAVYIIGGFVDKSGPHTLSHKKAEREGLQTYSLPLDEYIMWGAGTKSLSINQVFEIMLKMKITGDWKKAFDVVPRRKIRRISSAVLEKDSIEPDKLFLIDTSKKKTVLQ